MIKDLKKSGIQGFFSLLCKLADACLDHLVEVNVFRYQENDTQTLGFLYVKLDEKWWPPIFSCQSLELPWKENQPNISRIPSGYYKAQKYFSPKMKQLVILLENVPDRSWIEIHPFNTFSETKGCIGVGRRLDDINQDGKPDLVESKKAMNHLLSLLPHRFRVAIFDCFGEKQ